MANLAGGFPCSESGCAEVGVGSACEIEIRRSHNTWDESYQSQIRVGDIRHTTPHRKSALDPTAAHLEGLGRALLRLKTLHPRRIMRIKPASFRCRQRRAEGLARDAVDLPRMNAMIRQMSQMEV